MAFTNALDEELTPRKGERFKRASTTRHVAEVSVKADSGPEAAGLARRALDGLDSHLTPEMLASVRLLVTELITNSVRHAELDDDDKVLLTVRVTDSAVRVEVSDPGGGFEPDERQGDLELEGGWGLYLVDRLADRWGVANDEGTQVWLEMDLQPLHATA